MWRFGLVVGLLWMVMAGIILRLPRPAQDCGRFCWLELQLGTQAAATHQLLSQPSIERSYERENLDGADIVFSMGKGRLMRLDALWEDANQPPHFVELLLYMGEPQGIRVERRAISNFRGMTVYVIYRSSDQITLATLRRFSNSPRDFGEFRPRPDDEIVRLTRYSPQTRMALQTPNIWRGFGWYPLIEMCCR